MADYFKSGDYKDALDCLARIIASYGEEGEKYLPLFQLMKKEYIRKKERKSTLAEALAWAQSDRKIDTHSDTQIATHEKFPDLKI